VTISASLEPVEVPVSHEGLATATVGLRNDGDEPIDVRIDVTGEPAAWSWVIPATATVPAAGSLEVKAVFKAPRAPSPPAGPLPVGVRVTGAEPAGSAVSPITVDAMLSVAPFSDVYATLDPPMSQGPRQGRHRLVLDNRGNVAIEVTLAGAGGPASEPAPGVGPVPSSARPSAPGVTVEVEPRVVTVGAGSKATATVVARAGATFLRGHVRDHPFRVEGLADHGPPTTIGGILRQQASAPAWLPRAAVGLAALVTVAGVARATVLAPDDPAPGGVDQAAVAVDDLCPAAEHLGSAVHGQAQELAASGYAFLHADPSGCQPIRFPACDPVHYVLNDALAPPGAVDDVHAAVDRLAVATGLTFVYDGPTDEPLDAGRPAYQPERYGERWAPILIGWSTLGTGSGPDSSGDDIIVAGKGKPIQVSTSLVSGVLELNADVILNRDTQERLPGGFGEGITRGRVLLHELGHVIGLGHVSSPAQLMYAELAEHTSSTAEFGVGDRVGLRLVGREAGCLEAPPRPG
jgi:hypothetical protein